MAQVVVRIGKDSVVVVAPADLVYRFGYEQLTRCSR